MNLVLAFARGGEEFGNGFADRGSPLFSALARITSVAFSLIMKTGVRMK
jgi:hypothetical protein